VAIALLLSVFAQSMAVVFWCSSAPIDRFPRRCHRSFFYVSPLEERDPPVLSPSVFPNFPEVDEQVAYTPVFISHNKSGGLPLRIPCQARPLFYIEVRFTRAVPTCVEGIPLTLSSLTQPLKTRSRSIYFRRSPLI